MNIHDAIADYRDYLNDSLDKMEGYDEADYADEDREDMREQITEVETLEETVNSFLTGLSDMIIAGRLREVDIENDFQWLCNTLETLTGSPVRPREVVPILKCPECGWKGTEGDLRIIRDDGEVYIGCPVCAEDVKDMEQI